MINTMVNDFTEAVLENMQKFQNLDLCVRKRFEYPFNDHRVYFQHCDRSKGEIIYANQKTKNFIDGIATLIEDLHENPEKNTSDSDIHQILKYDKPFEFKSAPYFTLSPDGNQLRYWIGPHSSVTYDHVDSNGKNLIFSTYVSNSAHDFIYGFCLKHTLIIPKYSV